MIFMNETNLSLKYLIDQLHKEQTLTKEEWITLIEGRTPELSEYLFSWPVKNATVIMDTMSTSAV